MWRNSLTEVYKLSVGKKLCRNPENLSVMGDSIFDGNVSIGNATPKISLDIQRSDAIRLPSGTTDQRPNSDVDCAGYFRFNTSTNKFEGVDNRGNWINLGEGQNQLTDIIQTTLINVDPRTKNNIIENIKLAFSGDSDYSNNLYTGNTGSFNISPSSNNTIGNIVNLLYSKGGAIGKNDEYVSRIRMIGQNNNIDPLESGAQYGEIATQITNVIDNFESSRMKFTIMKNGNLSEILILEGRGYGTDNLGSSVLVNNRLTIKHNGFGINSENSIDIVSKNTANTILFNGLTCIQNKDNPIILDGSLLSKNKNIHINENITKPIELLKGVNPVISNIDTKNSLTLHIENDNKLPEGTIYNDSDNNGYLDFKNITTVLIGIVKDHEQTIRDLRLRIDNLEKHVDV